MEEHKVAQTGPIAERFCYSMLLFNPNGTADSPTYVLVSTGVTDLLAAS